MKRLNNLSARLRVNQLLEQRGHAPLDPALPYVDFATKLRWLTATTLIQVPFTRRDDAVAYVRLVALGGVKIPEAA
jgi:hypothetical protein